MKLKIFDKVILIMMLLAVLCAAVLIGVACWNEAMASTIAGYIYALLTSSVFNRILVSIAVLLLIFLTIRILFIRRRDESNSSSGALNTAMGIMIKNGEYGNSFITQDAIKSMAYKILQINPNIRNSQVEIIHNADNPNLSIQVKAIPLADANLTELAAVLQQDIKTGLEEQTGIGIENVEVLFESDMANNQQP